jgi:deferrochelatase/peroxidase EfeB
MRARLHGRSAAVSSARGSIMDETTSRHLRNASEVLLWIPIKRGFAEYDEQIVSYAARLSTFLKAVFALRRDSTELRGLDTAGPVERLQIVYNVQWTVHEESNRLLVAASFDRSWETYFRELADTTGALLDAIFCHCEGYKEHTCADGFDAFMEWVRSAQRPCDFFYSAAPDLSTDDLRYLRQLSRVSEAGLLAANVSASRIQVKPPAATADHPTPENIERALWGLHALGDQFAKHVVIGPDGRTEYEIFNGAVSALFSNEEAGVAEANRRLALQLEAAKLEAQTGTAHGGAAPPPATLAALDDLGKLLSWSRAFRGQETDRKRKLIEPLQKTDVQVLNAAQLDSIQGGILTDYPVTTHGAVALVQCDTRESWGEFLAYIAMQITSELERVRSRDEKTARPWVNLGLTFRGLERLGLPDGVLQQFPKEFREGMEARAGLLGDIGNPDYPLETGPLPKVARGSDAPRVRTSSADAIVWVQGYYPELTREDLSWWTKENPVRTWLDELAKLKGVRVLAEEPLQRQFSGEAPGKLTVREHFGFEEGEKRSQPVPRVAYEGFPNAGPAYAAAAARDSVRLGEILLGYRNQRGESPRSAPLDGEDLLRDGSFLVMRKLRQHVGAFRDFVQAAAKRLELHDDEFKSLVVGRSPVDAAALIASQSTNQNDFHFDDDSDGVRCPAFSHIRRVNPRTRADLTLVPRILRRGFLYGPRCGERNDAQKPLPEESADRGLFFLAYNANIAEQFEVIQRWVNGGNVTGMLSAQQDLLAGQGPVSCASYWHRSSDPSRDKEFGPPKQPLVSLQWGAYLFVPSKETLRKLHEFARRTQCVEAEDAATRGEMIIERLLAHPAARDAWKKLLEEPLSASDAFDLWQAVRLRRGGALRTAYGVLVANLDLAARVLGDDGDQYSVSAYHTRLGNLVGPHYLGMDRAAPDYAALATDPNEFAHTQIPPAEAFELARRIATAALRQGLTNRGRRETHVRRLAEVVVAGLCNRWFELPIDRREWLSSLVFTSRYAFQVSPGSWLENLVPEQHALIAAARPNVPRSAMRTYLESKEYPRDKIELALNGAIVGFAAPAIASVISILDTWSNDGELWRLAEIVASSPDPTYSTASSALLGPVLHALERKPVPSLLYRTARRAVGPIAPGSNVQVEKDDPIIVGLGAIYADARKRNVAAPEQWLFGGEYTATPIRGAVEDPAAAQRAGTGHGCPARNAALAALVGTFSAVLGLPDLRLERRFVVSYSAE